MNMRSQIYVDKSGLLEETNRLIDTQQRFVCLSRPRRFGKSMAADMLSAYYGCKEDTSALFDGLKIGRMDSYRAHLNQCNVLKVNMQEFHHGLLRSEPNWLILSNAESGEGFSDILVEPEDPDAGMVIEVKYTGSISGLDKACARAMEQIKARRYDERLRNDGRVNILAYGIAFYKKRCKAVCERL